VNAGTKVSVGLALRNADLRGLVRVDLERSGFDVLGDTVGADVVVTESSQPRGRLLTVRVTEARAMPSGDQAIALGPYDLSRLPELLRDELRVIDT
jgi:hypothetical protein